VGHEVQQEEDEVAVGEAVRRGNRLLAVGRGIPGAILLTPWSSQERSRSEEIGGRPAATDDEHGAPPESPADRIEDQR